MGTLLQDNGLDDGGAGELWNVDRPDVIRACHEAYAEAGARLLTTNTFGGTRPRLQMHGLEDRVHELNRAAAADRPRGRRRARHPRRRRPRSDRRAARAARHDGRRGGPGLFEEQLRGLREGGIDVVLIETMSDLGEVQAAVAAARSVVPDLPIIATLSLRHQPPHDDGRPSRRRRAPRSPRPASTRSAPTAAAGPEEMAVIAAQLAEARPEGLLLVAQSNAGLPQVVGDHFEYDATPADMAEHAARAARARHRPDRWLLRLDARAHRRDARRRPLTRCLLPSAVVLL